MQYLSRLITIVVISLLSACIMFEADSADYKEVKTDFKNQSDIVAKYGNPVNKVAEKDGAEIWYYKTSQTKNYNAIVFIVIPFWWTTEYNDNEKFVFYDTQLVKAYKRDFIESGFSCGLFVSHGASCGSYHNVKQ